MFRTRSLAMTGLLFIASAMLLLFHNCTPLSAQNSASDVGSQRASYGFHSDARVPLTPLSPGAPGSPSLNNSAGGGLSGNGGGYDGKVTFVARSLGASCADGTDIKAQIVISKSLGSGKGAEPTATLVRSNCADIQPVALSLESLNWMPHNPSNLVFEETPFDEPEEIEDPVTTLLLCRTTGSPQLVSSGQSSLGSFFGSQTSTSGLFSDRQRTSQTPRPKVTVGDVVIRAPLSEITSKKYGKLSAKVMVGVYNPGGHLIAPSTKSTEVNLDVTLQERYGKIQSADQRLIVNRTPLSGGSSAYGTLSYKVPVSSSSLMATWPDDGIPAFTAQVNCYRQDPDDNDL